MGFALKALLAAAAAATLVFAGLIVREMRRPPRPATSAAARVEERTSPLTDMAPTTTQRPLEEQAVPSNPAPINPDIPTAEPIKAIPPRDMPDPLHPPMGTKTMATSPNEVVPPDPAVPPTMQVDPDRGRTP